MVDLSIVLETFTRGYLMGTSRGFHIFFMVMNEMNGGVTMLHHFTMVCFATKLGCVPGKMLV